MGTFTHPCEDEYWSVPERAPVRVLELQLVVISWNQGIAPESRDPEVAMWGVVCRLGAIDTYVGVCRNEGLQPFTLSARRG